MIKKENTLTQTTTSRGNFISQDKNILKTHKKELPKIKK